MPNNVNVQNMGRERIEEQDVLSVEDWLHYIGNYRDDKKEKIIKFVFTWMKYNNWYSEKYENKKGDRAKATAISNNKDANIIYKELKDEFIHSFSNIGCSFGDRREGIYKNDGMIKVAYNLDVDCLCKFLNVVYQIRCNFFHGAKIPSEENVELICWAYKTLSKLLEKWEENGVIKFK